MITLHAFFAQGVQLLVAEVLQVDMIGWFSVTADPTVSGVPFCALLHATVPPPLPSLITLLMTIDVVPVKGYTIAVTALKMFVMSLADTEAVCATRSAALDARLVTFWRHSRAFVISTEPSRKVTRTGAMKANSTAARPSFARRNFAMRPSM